jgi:hypothetical protein
MSSANPLSAHDVLRREWRQLGRLVFESAITGLVVSIVLALAVFVVSFEAQAAIGNAMTRSTSHDAPAASGRADGVGPRAPSGSYRTGGWGARP